MSYNQPLFSILIASYNNGRFIHDAFKSIFSQSYTNWEVIIVDDGSTDDSVELIKKASADNTLIKLFQNDKNRGVGYTKFRCAELATGSLMGFLDPDDALEPNAIELNVEYHLKYPDASLIYSNCYICDDQLGIKNLSEVKPLPVGKTLLDAIELPDVWVSHFATFKKILYNRTPGMDKNCLRAIDQDLYLKLEEVGDLLHINEPLYRYRMHDGGISLGGNSIKANSWFIYVIINTCKRRGLQFEDYIPKILYRDIILRERMKRDYKVGKALLTPLRFVKKIFNK